MAPTEASVKQPGHDLQGHECADEARRFQILDQLRRIEDLGEHHHQGH